MTVTIDQSPKITDTILFTINTVDINGDAVTPDFINKVIIYYLVRDFTHGKGFELDTTIDNVSLTTFFSEAQVIKTYGDDSPAWLSTDTDASSLTNTDTGVFTLTWQPEFAREGDYIICWSWTPMIGDDPLSAYQQFSLASDTTATTSIPTHFTNPEKYSTLLERYTPDYLKMKLGDNDLTPDVIDKLNNSVADGFTILEDLQNQAIDLIDANAIHEQLLPYLSNFFDLVLRSTDSTLWRRQIKRAIPLYKKKGTEAGLEEALAQAGIRLNSLTRLWQVISPYSWTESFTVSNDQSEFELAKTPSDLVDFQLYIRYSGDADYTTLTTDYASISYSVDDAIYLLTWIGDELMVDPISLSDGDIVKVIYTVHTVIDSGIEDYILALPLLDQRDEAEITFPLKNWNVHVIEETDAMFDTICTNRHPFHDPIVFGKIRTEFAYSENIYNMEEYNGSVRDSTLPCDMNKDFLDPCSCCLSSAFNVDVEIEHLSSARLNEVQEIIRDYVPFHAIVQQVNSEGAVTEFLPPMMESTETLLNLSVEDQIVIGKSPFNRIMEDALDGEGIARNALANASVAASDTGTGVNSVIVMHSPNTRFDMDILPLDPVNNLLEILSGPDTGEYAVHSPTRSHVAIFQTSPDTLGYPLNTSTFTFRMSNVKFTGTYTSITQSDYNRFYDSNVNLIELGVAAGWQIVVSSPVSGTFIINEVLPDNSVILSSWTGGTSVDNISYQLQNDSAVNVGDPSTSGSVRVTKRAIVDGGSAFVNSYRLVIGDYIKIGAGQYQIIGIIDTQRIYIKGWTLGNMGATGGSLITRIIESAIGHLGVSGMVLTTTTNYETSLSMSNGANNLGPLVENSQFVENFLVLIGSDYYQIAEINGTTITLAGPPVDWGFTGTSVNFSIIQFDKQAVEINNQTFEYIDRRNGDYAVITTDASTTIATLAAALNAKGNFETQSIGEHVQIIIAE